MYYDENAKKKNERNREFAKKRNNRVLEASSVRVCIETSFSRVLRLSQHINFYTFEMRADHIKIPNNLLRLLRTVLEKHHFEKTRSRRNSRPHKKGGEEIVEKILWMIRKKKKHSRNYEKCMCED